MATVAHQIIKTFVSPPDQSCEILLIAKYTIVTILGTQIQYWSSVNCIFRKGGEGQGVLGAPPLLYPLGGAEHPQTSATRLEQNGTKIA